MGWWRVWGAECGCGERVVEGEKGSATGEATGAGLRCAVRERKRVEGVLGRSWWVRCPACVRALQAQRWRRAATLEAWCATWSPQCQVSTCVAHRPLMQSWRNVGRRKGRTAPHLRHVELALELAALAGLARLLEAVAAASAADARHGRSVDLRYWSESESRETSTSNRF